MPYNTMSETILATLGAVSTTVARKYFFIGPLLAGALPAMGFRSVPSLRAAGYKSPNEKLNLASIGAGGQPLADLVAAAAGFENVVALADCDWNRGAAGFARYPRAARYKDFRQMLDKSGKEIDAVIVGTPDHNHAICALACMQLGKHVYAEKPLTKTVQEARLLEQAAEKYKVATQMGNQGYSHDATRVAAEIIWSGEIGDVTEVHGWSGGTAWPMSIQKVPPPSPVPETLDWDVWLGGAAWREFTAGDAAYRSEAGAQMALIPRRPSPPPSPNGHTALELFSSNWSAEFGFYLPWNWRAFYDFSSGLFGDFGVHMFGPANWALQLHPKYLRSVEVLKKEGTSPFMYATKNSVKYDFAARGSMPPVSVYWSDGVDGVGYVPPGMTAEEARRVPGQGPQVGPPSIPWPFNCIFAGSKGYLGTGGRGEAVGLIPAARWKQYTLPEAYLPRSPGATTGDNHAAHCRDWIRACKGGAPACSNFSISGPYTEWVILAAVASHYQGKLLWDYDKMEFTNNKDAGRWIRPAYRKGWEINL
jgi:predicted dehydrogenase